MWCPKQVPKGDKGDGIAKVAESQKVTESRKAAKRPFRHFCSIPSFLRIPTQAKDFLNFLARKGQNHHFCHFCSILLFPRFLTFLSFTPLSGPRSEVQGCLGPGPREDAKVTFSRVKTPGDGLW